MKYIDDKILIEQLTSLIHRGHLERDNPHLESVLSGAICFAEIKKSKKDIQPKIPADK